MGRPYVAIFGMGMGILRRFSGQFRNAARNTASGNHASSGNNATY
jgi:hypothetical protein